MKLNPENTDERRNTAMPAVPIKGSLVWVVIRREKYVAREIRVMTHPTISGEVGTKNTILRPTKSHKATGRIRC
jgi:hypothetical protein